MRRREKLQQAVTGENLSSFGDSFARCKFNAELLLTHCYRYFARAALQ